MERRSTNETQISTYITDATREQLDHYVEAHGLKKGHLIETALLHHLQALRELPTDVIIPPQLILSADSFEKVAAHVTAPRAPTDAMHALMGTKPSKRAR